MCVAQAKIFTYTRCSFGKNRKKSIEDGCCVYLCGRHHNQSNEGVHFDHFLDIFIKQKMETMWLKYYNKTIDDFIKRYGRNYYGMTTYEYKKIKENKYENESSI